MDQGVDGSWIVDYVGCGRESLLLSMKSGSRFAMALGSGMDRGLWISDHWFKDSVLWVMDHG